MVVTNSVCTFVETRELRAPKLGEYYGVPTFNGDERVVRCGITNMKKEQFIFRRIK